MSNIKYFYDIYEGEVGPLNNSLGKLTRVIDASGTNLYFYDNMGNITNDVKKIIDDRAYTNIMGVPFHNSSGSCCVPVIMVM